MTSHNGVEFKVFVSTEGDKIEVRRFAIDREVVTNFEYLKAKLHSVFPSIKDKTYTVSWKGMTNYIKKIVQCTIMYFNFIIASGYFTSSE